MITNDPKQIEILKKGGKILATILNLVASRVKPGVTAYELDQIAEAEIKKSGGRASFKNYQPAPDVSPFPSSLCVSVNDEVVHGIAYKHKVLKSGDIVGLDLGLEYKGLYTDTAVTVPVGNVDKESQKLINVTTECLAEAINVIRAGVRTGDVGAAIESMAKKNGFSVVKDLVGHGVGLAVHEDPEIPCYGKPGTGTVLVEGMVIAVEPMLNFGKSGIIFDKDLWTIKTADGSRSAHMEHTLLVTKKGCEIITEQ